MRCVTQRLLVVGGAVALVAGLVMLATPVMAGYVMDPGGSDTCSGLVPYTRLTAQKKAATVVLGDATARVVEERHILQPGQSVVSERILGTWVASKPAKNIVGLDWEAVCQALIGQPAGKCPEGSVLVECSAYPFEAVKK